MDLIGWLLLGGFIPRFQVPYWVMLLCATAITLGTMSGGWRIVRTVGLGIYKLRPGHGLASQLAITQRVSIEFVHNLGPTHHSIAVRSGQLPFLGSWA